MTDPRIVSPDAAAAHIATARQALDHAEYWHDQGAPMAARLSLRIAGQEAARAIHALAAGRVVAPAQHLRAAVRGLIDAARAGGAR